MSTGKMHVDEVPINSALVGRLIDSQFPHWAPLPLTAVRSAGTDHAIYRLGADMAVRLPRVPAAAGQVDTEHRWLPQLAAQLPVDIPTPLGKGRPDQGYPLPWSIYRWLDGESALTATITNYRPIAEDLGHFAAALRTVNPTGGPTASRGVPLIERDGEAREALDALHGLIDVTAAIAAWEAALQVPVWQGPPTWIHGDLLAGNLLIRDGQLSAVIDFGLMGVGDPACDALPAWAFLPAEARDTFRTAINLDEDTWARGRGWALYFGLVALPYYQVTNPVLAGIARQAIDAVLADH